MKKLYFSLIVFALIPLPLLSSENELPDIKNLLKNTPSIPLRVFTRDGQLIAEFGDKRKTPVKYDKIPRLMVYAFIAGEDPNFFAHAGVDQTYLIKSLLAHAKQRSVYGGSTITMQVARNRFFSHLKSHKRKQLEILTAYKIEKKYSKEQILEYYLNSIYLGNRSYGVSGAAQVYYGKSLQELSLAQIPMIAGLPKAPSIYNPFVNPKRALIRRNYILQKMLSLAHINNEQYRQAIKEKISATRRKRSSYVRAPYVAEMVRKNMSEKYGRKAYEDGYNVYTTLLPQYQQAATAALQNTLLDYSQRHGYRGPISRKSIPEISTLSVEKKREMLSGYFAHANLIPALVTSVSERDAKFFIAANVEGSLMLKDITWARKYISTNHIGPKIKKVSDVLQAGNIVYITKKHDKQWSLAQAPEIQGTLISLDAKTVLSLGRTYITLCILGIIRKNLS